MIPALSPRRWTLCSCCRDFSRLEMSREVSQVMGQVMSREVSRPSCRATRKTTSMPAQNWTACLLLHHIQLIRKNDRFRDLPERFSQRKALGLQTPEGFPFCQVITFHQDSFCP